jgi:hypothetical protein
VWAWGNLIAGPQSAYDSIGSLTAWWSFSRRQVPDNPLWETPGFTMRAPKDAANEVVLRLYDLTNVPKAKGLLSFSAPVGGAWRAPAWHIVRVMCRLECASCLS